MKLKMKQELMRVLIPAVIAILMAGSYIVFLGRTEHFRKNYLQTGAAELGSQYLISVEAYAQVADMVYRFFIDTEEVTGPVAAGMAASDPAARQAARDLLLAALDPLYRDLTSRSFRQLHFHDSDNRSFLRFHRPELFGDDLTEVRYSIARVNEILEPYAGFEEGRIFNGYRYVFPLFHEGGHIGSVEISISIETIVETMRKNFGRPTQFILQHDIVEEIVFPEEQGNYTPWSIDDRFLLDNSFTDVPFPSAELIPRDRKRIRAALDEHLKAGTPFSLEIAAISAGNMISFHPLSGLGEEAAAYLVSFSRNESLQLLRRNALSFTIFYGILFLLIAGFYLHIMVAGRKIEFLATHDFLTRLQNRTAIEARLQQVHEQYLRTGQNYAVIMIDVDHFKTINDRFGHGAGDQVLTGLSRTMLSAIRTGDSIGRYGGEEFLVLLPGADRQTAGGIAERIRAAVASAGCAHGEPVTISGGAADAKEIGSKLSGAVIDLADQRLFAAKRGGRNRIEPGFGAQSDGA